MEEKAQKPAYIDFLLSPRIREQLGFHVNVGTTDTEMERIGCLRWMLIARSKVLRTMLLESELKVGKEMDVTDLKPSTFKDLLTFIYGHDHTNSLKFEECIDLLGAAEKYDVDDLKDRLGSLITPMVSAENVCSILELGPVCETVPELWEKTTEIIQSKTDIVFGLPQFLMLSPSAVVHILQQEALSVMEIDVWRAALKWAKAQLNCSPDTGTMRDVMLPLLRHTRLCTLTPAQLCKEVVSANVITMDEFKNICCAVSEKEEQSDLLTVCSIVESRRRYEVPGNTVVREFSTVVNRIVRDSKYLLSTDSTDINLMSISLLTNAAFGDIKGSVYISKFLQHEVKEHLCIFRFNNKDASSYDISMRVLLKADSKYEMLLKFCTEQIAHCPRTGEECCLTSSGDRLEVKVAVHPHTGLPANHLSAINYHVIR